MGVTAECYGEGGQMGGPRHVGVGGNTFDVKTAVSWDALSAVFRGLLPAALAAPPM